MGNPAVVALVMRHFHCAMHPDMVNEMCSGHAFVHRWSRCILHGWVPGAFRPSSAATVEIAISCGAALPVVVTAGVTPMVVLCYRILRRLALRIFTTLFEKPLGKPENPMAWLVVAGSALGPPVLWMTPLRFVV